MAVWYWAPRVLCILAIAFFSLFALDSFDLELSLVQQVVGFVIHMIPSAVLALLLWMAWKRELAGGIIFILISLLLTPVVFIGNYNNNHSLWISTTIVLMVTFPFFVVGVLFLLSRRAKLRAKQDSW